MLLLPNLELGPLQGFLGGLHLGQGMVSLG